MVFGTRNSAIEEEWRPVKDYESLYEVSNLGRIRSKRGILSTKKQMKSGYHSFGLFKNGKRTYRTLHRLVTESFYGARPAGLEVRHLNGDVNDNRLSNLVYGTHIENEKDKKLHNTHHQINKTSCNRSHLLCEPNLVPSLIKKGYRSCLACSRARTWIYKNPMRFDDLQDISDIYYKKLMGLDNSA